MRHIAVLAIAFYQRALSPYKGFCCAYRQLHSGESCSDTIRRIVLADGTRAGLRALPMQLNACRHAARTLPRAELDCGIGGCAAAEGCGLFGAAEAGSGAGAANCSLSFSAGALIVLLVVALVAGYWFYGRQIAGIEIQLIDAATEVEDKRLFGLLDGRPPDYKLTANRRPVRRQ